MGGYMQDDQQYNSGVVNGIGLPPTLQTSDQGISSDSTLPSLDENVNKQLANDPQSIPTIDKGQRAPLNNASTASNAVSDDPSSSELLDIKRKALQQLQPLVDRLDLSPEEKFNTTMMMIQASDDQSLINKAFDAAQNIANEKDRAQALLDIVNEINYFTHTENV